MEETEEFEKLLNNLKYTNEERECIIRLVCKQFNCKYGYGIKEFYRPYNPIFGGCCS